MVMQMPQDNAENLLNSLAEFENSEEAKEMRTRIAAIAEKIGAAPKRSDMTDIFVELAKIKMLLRSNHNLNSLYGIRAKLLLEEAEFKRTGVRVLFD